MREPVRLQHKHKYSEQHNNLHTTHQHNGAESVRSTLAAGGQPLDTTTRATLEPRFGHSFADVRVHSDAQAAESAAALSARAYTVGSNIVFDDGQYAPETSEGQHLLAHELTHVVQQARAGHAGNNPLSRTSDAAEVEATSVATQVQAGQSVSVQATPSATVARDEDEKPPVDLGDVDSWPENQPPVDLGDVDSWPENQPPSVAMTQDKKEKPFWDSPIFKAIARGAGLLPGPIGPVAKILNHPFQIARGAEEASEGKGLQAAADFAGAAAGVVGGVAGLSGFSMLGAGGLGGMASAVSSGGLGVLGTVGGLGAEAGATMSASAAVTGGGLSGVAALGPGAAVLGAGAAGVGIGLGLDKASDWIGDKITGNDKADHSISAGIGSGLNAIDAAIHGVSDDPLHNPNENYRKTWGYRLAQWLDD